MHGNSKQKHNLSLTYLNINDLLMTPNLYNVYLETKKDNFQFYTSCLFAKTHVKFWRVFAFAKRKSKNLEKVQILRS